MISPRLPWLRPLLVRRLGRLQVLPKSVVRAKYVGWLLRPALKRSHITYATPGCTGSAVTDSLSFKILRLLSALSLCTSPQVLPPSCETAADTALRPVTRSTEMP